MSPLDYGRIAFEARWTAEDRAKRYETRWETLSTETQAVWRAVALAVLVAADRERRDDPARGLGWTGVTDKSAA